MGSAVICPAITRERKALTYGKPPESLLSFGPAHRAGGLSTENVTMCTASPDSDQCSEISIWTPLKRKERRIQSERESLHEREQDVLMLVEHFIDE
jgi:hypothetical protein